MPVDKYRDITEMPPPEDSDSPTENLRDALPESTPQPVGTAPEVRDPYEIGVGPDIDNPEVMKHARR